ncbi:hypothetical protein JM47_01470 [Ureaplasma diversum]|uniref:PTS EIIB type-1 domain-containing protein n=2 Tax=Ureaplasma diversum TaxID=42094 RepID=A0A084F1F3_9BACT|nr:hypothetical protein [Ureaplasma diversum]AJQ45282.1 hypothetical protein JM47_01470 [Ureaplasma diversum]KEZ24045.1 Hypothetical protein, putative phosphotransferase system PTS, glucose-specific EIIB component [Ureaplasma diversum NCTC 246]
MKNWKIILLYIVTFSIAYWVMRKKAKQQAQIKNDNLIVSKKLPFSVDNFYAAVGSIFNIKETTSTLNTLKITLNDPSLFNQDQVIGLGAKGVMKNNSTFSIVFGDFATTLKDVINQDLANQNN